MKKSKLSKTLRASEFKVAVAKFPRMSENGQAVARAILVDGESLADVAARYGIHRSQAHQWAVKVLEGHRPQGWVTETISLPAPLMQKVKEMARVERERWERSTAG